MNYEDQNSLNDLDVAEPLDGASPAELLAAFRQLKAVVKNTLLTSHYPDGRIRVGELSQVAESAVGSVQLAPKAVVVGKLDDGAVTTIAIGDEQVTEDKLADGSVVESKYADASIPASAFKPNTMPLETLAGFITAAYLSAHVSNNALRAVTENAIANEAVVDRAIKTVGAAKLTGGADTNVLVKVAGVWTPVALSGGLSYNSESETFTTESGVKVAIVADTKSRGAEGGSAVSGTWNLRTLGELIDDDNLLTFSANKFKLALGKYFFYVECPAYNVGLHQARLFNVTDNTAVLWGSSATATAASGITTRSVLVGFVESTDVDTEYQVEHWIATAVGSSDLGKASSSDNTLPVGPAPFSNHREVYTQGFLVKIG